MDKREKEFIEKYDMKPIVDVMDDAIAKLSMAKKEFMHKWHKKITQAKEKERERCAKIVETWTITTQEEQNLREAGVDDRKLIAKAIRDKE